MKTIVLSKFELFAIRGGDSIKPIPRPRDVYDDEEEAKAAAMSASSEEEFNWGEWLKKWLDKRF